MELNIEDLNYKVPGMKSLLCNVLVRTFMVLNDQQFYATEMEVS